MSDARTLLRQQQATRRITSPHAVYSSTGKLSCALCNSPVKTEALWDAHARSAPHRAALQSLAQNQSRAAEPSAGAKRKLEDDEDGPEDDGGRRKRSRGDIAPPTLTPASSTSTSRASNTPSQGVELSIPSRPATPKTAAPSALESQPSALDSQRKPSQSVDEAEWAAFEADIAAATAPYSEDAVISAPAVPAGGEQEDEQDKDGARGPRDVEIEGEREDAERALADEFDEMEELEARARKLKERREALRARSRVDLKSEAKSEKGVDKENKTVEEEDEEEESEEEDDDYAWGGLRYAGRA